MAIVAVNTSDYPKAARAGAVEACWFAAAALMVYAALAGPWLLGYDYVRDDLGAFHAPLRAFYAHQIAQGEPFDWMPELFCGFYLTGEGQLGGYHPLKWTLYRLLPLRWAMGLEYLLPYPALAIGAWFWLRRLLGRADAAAYGALTLACSSFSLMRLIHPHAVAVVAHLPWLLWLADVLFDARRDGRAWAALRAQWGIALLTASQLLLGYPQYVWFTWLALGFVCVGRVFSAGVCEPRSDAAPSMALPSACPGRPTCRTPSEGLRCAVALLAAVACGLLLAGVQLLPTVDALGESVRRSAGAEFSAAGSWRPLNAVQWIAPYLFVDRVVGRNTHELIAYLGAAPLLLAVWACLSRRDDRLGCLVMPTLAAAALALLLAFGEFGPLHPLLSGIPLVGSFRFPCRALVLFQFAVAVLAGIGYARVFSAQSATDCGLRPAAAANGGSSDDSRSPRRPMWAIALLCGASWLMALWALVWGPAEIIASPAAVLAGPLLLLMGAGLVIAAVNNRRWAAAALAVFTAADLGYSGLSYSVYAPGALARHSAAIDPSAASFRVVCDLALGQLPQQRTGNGILAFGVSRADGYAGLEPQRPWWPWPAAFPPPAAVDLLRRASVQFVRQTEETARLGLPRAESPATDLANDRSAAGADGSADAPAAGHCCACLPTAMFPARWLAVPNPLPKVRLESAADLPAESRTESPATSPAESRSALPAAPPISGRVATAVDRPGRMQFQVETPMPARLVVAESWHRGWQAQLNRRPVELGPTADGFLAIAVPAGSHHVAIEFDPPSLRLGRRLSLCGVIALCVLAISCGCCCRNALPPTDRMKAPHQ